MNYQPTKIFNLSLYIWLIALATFLSNCSPRDIDVSTTATNDSWDGVQGAEFKKKFKTFIGGWDGMTYDNFLDKVAQSIKNQPTYQPSSKKDASTVAYYIPAEYIPSQVEKIAKKIKSGPFYQAAFHQEYSKISGKFKKIYDSFLILPNNNLIRSKDASLFVVACFFKFTEQVDQALKDPNLDNEALIKRLNDSLNDFLDEIQKVDRKSNRYPNKDVHNVAMGMVIIPNDENKITFTDNTIASYSMNARCMITQKLARFTYEQCKEIKTEIDKLANDLKKAAEKISKPEEHP